MQHSQKAAEPTMEEILASIRKIIAEDPNSPPPAPPARTPPPASQAHPPAAPSSPRVTAPAPQLPALNSVGRSTSALDRDLADLLGEPATDAPASKSITGSAKGTAAGDPATPPAPLPGTEKAAAGALHASESPAPSSRMGWLRGRPNSGPASTQFEPTLPAVPPTTVDSGSSTPAPPGPRTSEQKPVASAAPQSKVAETQPAPKPVIAAPRSLVPPGSASKESAKPNAAIAAAAAVTSKAASGATPAIVPTSSGTSERGGDASPGGQTKAAPVGTSVSPSPSAEKKEDAASPTKPDTLPIDMVPPPARMYATPVPATPQRRDVENVGGLSRSEVGAALDDALAQLLRPMVREWLDENMSRALTKAVEIEIAERAQKELAKRKSS